MNLQLDGKRALVTGSSAGIGEAIARTLAAEGCTVIVHGRNAERAARVADSIREGGGSVDWVTGDLATDAGGTRIARRVLHTGPVDILVNNAGAYENLSWETASPDKWIETVQSDALSSVRMIQALVPGMRERQWGRVIQIGSGTGSQPFGGYPQCCAAKAMTHAVRG